MQGTSDAAGRYTKALRHLHNSLALLERSEELAVTYPADKRKGAAGLANFDDEATQNHAALVTSTRLQTFFHIAMYENVSWREV